MSRTDKFSIAINFVELIADLYEVAGRDDSIRSLADDVLFYVKQSASEKLNLALSQNLEKGPLVGANVFFVLMDALCVAALKNNAENVSSICELLKNLIEKFDSGWLQTILTQKSNQREYEGTTLFYWLMSALCLACAGEDAEIVEAVNTIILMLIEKCDAAQLQVMLTQKIEQGKMTGSTPFYWFVSALYFLATTMQLNAQSMQIVNSTIFKLVKKYDAALNTLKPPVNIHSLDADGCFLPCVTKNYSYRTMAQHNHPFVSALLAEQHKNQGHTIFLAGTARQDWFRDLLCLNQIHQGNILHISESYFYALKNFVSDINQSLPVEKQIVLDTFLLNDVCFNKPSGYTFEKTIQSYGLQWSEFIRNALNEDSKLKFDKPHTDYDNQLDELRKKTCEFFTAEEVSSTDELISEQPGKFALVYTQIHHIASQFSPETPLHFHFYDDHFIRILEPLIFVFKHSPELAPRNMRLYFHHYLSGQVQLNSEDGEPVVKEVQGMGKIDFDYRETLCDMMARLQSGFVRIDRAAEKKLSARGGNPIDCFFEVISQHTVNTAQASPSTLTVTPLDAFDEFNKKRLTRINQGLLVDRKCLSRLSRGLSSADFFIEMRRLEHKSHLQSVDPFLISTP